MEEEEEEEEEDDDDLTPEEKGEICSKRLHPLYAASAKQFVS
jgi:hypothetical protein